MRRWQKFLVVCLLLAGSFDLHADDSERPAPSGGVLSLLPAPVTTAHSTAIGGRTLEYKAKAGTFSLLGGNGDVTAEIFYTAYSVPIVIRHIGRQRPITFVFNGGPGAASAYLHLGALGPRIIATS